VIFLVFQDLDSNDVTRFRWFCTWFFRTPVNKFSMDDRIQTGFLGSNGFSVFQGFGRSGFSRLPDAWTLVFRIGILRVSLDVGHLAFRILIWVLLVFLGYWFFSEFELDLVFRIGSFSFADTKMEKCDRE